MACAAFRSGNSPWDGSHTPIPSANLPFWPRQIIGKVIWFYFTHCLTSKTELFFLLCISDAALSVLIKNTCAHVFIPTCTYSHTWCMYSNHMHTLLQPKLCCPFILQVMTKINCELHSICTEFTVQMNSNEEYIGIHKLLSIYGLCVFVLFRYFLVNITISYFSFLIKSV